MKTRDIENNLHDIELHLRHLEAEKDHEAAVSNPQEELKKLRHLLPASLSATQKNSLLASRVARVTERLDTACKKWEGNAHLDVLTRHYTEYQSWEEQCQAPGTPRFDWRVPALRVLAEAYDFWAMPMGRGVSLKPYEAYFTGPGYDTELLEFEIEQPHSLQDAKTFVENSLTGGYLKIPFAYRLDSKAFITDYARVISNTMGQRWREVSGAIEGKHIDALRAEMEKEHDLQRFKQATINALHSLAWQRGHSSGFEEVKSHYPELVELLETTLA